jgi:hypothetical protein
VDGWVGGCVGGSPVGPWSMHPAGGSGWHRDTPAARRRENASAAHPTTSLMTSVCPGRARSTSLAQPSIALQTLAPCSHRPWLAIAGFNTLARTAMQARSQLTFHTRSSNVWTTHAHNHIQDDRRPARCGNLVVCSSAATSNCTLTGSSSRSVVGWRELQLVGCGHRHACSRAPSMQLAKVCYTTVPITSSSVVRACAVSTEAPTAITYTHQCDERTYDDAVGRYERAGGRTGRHLSGSCTKLGQMSRSVSQSEHACIV